MLACVFGSCRFVYNYFLRLRIDAWYKEKKSITYCQTSSMLTDMKQQKDTAWLNDISCVPVQQSLRHLQTAFRRFFDKLSRYPTFKKKRGTQSAEYTRSAFKWDADNRNLYIAGLGRLKVRWSRTFRSKPTTVTISKEPSGRYFVTLCLDEKIEKLPKTGQEVGIDLGVSSLATLSTGEKIDNPRWLDGPLRKLKRLQRVMARRQKGSGRRERIRLRIALLQEHISDARMDFLHKLTTGLVRCFDVIAIEDLNVRGMLANHCLARAIANVGMGEFRRMIDYKCTWYGKEIKVVNRFFPSSKRCFDCGHIVDNLPLNIREWYCPECGAWHDRDVNAAMNILAAGQAVTAQGGIVRRKRGRPRSRKSRRTVNHPVEHSCSSGIRPL